MQVRITAGGLNRNCVNERSAFTATASFYSDSYVLTAPTSASYRLDRVTDDPACFQEITSWSSLTPATSISIPISATQNAIVCDSNRSERHQITVKANDGLSTQTQVCFRYSVLNQPGQL